MGGDFNVILNEEENWMVLTLPNRKLLILHNVLKIALSELKFTGSKYTWWNRRINNACVFKRLDRVLANPIFWGWFPTSEVQYLVREGSDHVPIHVVCKS